MLGRVKLKHITQSFVNNRDIYNDDFRSSIFEENFFDDVTCYALIEHLEDPFSFISDVKKILKPGGLFTIFTMLKF